MSSIGLPMPHPGIWESETRYYHWSTQTPYATATDECRLLSQHIVPRLQLEIASTWL